MKPRIWFALIAVYLIWGSTYLAIRFAVESIPPFLMAGSRFLIAGSLLYIWRRLSGDEKPTPRHWRSAMIVGLLLLLGGNGGVVWSEQFVPSGITALLIGTEPIWIVLIDGLRPNGIRPNLPTILGVVMGFLGVVLLIAPSIQTNGEDTYQLIGMVIILFAAFSWALGSLYNRGAALPDSSLLGTSMSMLSGGIALTLVGTFTGEWVRLDIDSIQLDSMIGWLYLVIFGSLVAFVAYTWLLRVAPTPLVSTYAYVNPVVAIVLGSLVAEEPLTFRIILSAAIVVGSVALINSARNKLWNSPEQIHGYSLANDD